MTTRPGSFNRTPPPSASNSIPDSSSAPWIARNVEPFASLPCSILYIVAVETPARAASCAWVKRVMARPTRICATVIISLPLLIINYQAYLTIIREYLSISLKNISYSAEEQDGRPAKKISQNGAGGGPGIDRQNRRCSCGRR